METSIITAHQTQQKPLPGWSTSHLAHRLKTPYQKHWPWSLRLWRFCIQAGCMKYLLWWWAEYQEPYWSWMHTQSLFPLHLPPLSVLPRHNPRFCPLYQNGLNPKISHPLSLVGRSPHQAWEDPWVWPPTSGYSFHRHESVCYSPICTRYTNWDSP